MGTASISLVALCGVLLASCQVRPQGAVAPASAGSPVVGPQHDGCVPNDLPVEDGFITAADGARLYYRRVGRGRPVAIYLHGGPGGTMYNGGCEMAPLARDHPLILYDQRGGGRSETVSEAARLELAKHVADLEAIRRHFGLERVALIGLSWCGAGDCLCRRASQPRDAFAAAFAHAGREDTLWRPEVGRCRQCCRCDIDGTAAAALPAASVGVDVRGGRHVVPPAPWRSAAPLFPSSFASPEPQWL